MEKTVCKLNGKDFVRAPKANAEKLQGIIDGFGSVGGEMIFSKGRYKFSTVFLRSNITLTFENGAEIYGSGNFDDYCPDEKVDHPLYQDASHSFFHCSLFCGENLENVTVRGKGTVDMQSVWDGEYKRKISSRGAKAFAFKNCKNLLFDGFTVLNATDLALYFAGCDGVEAKGLKFRTYIDGISPDNSKNVYIHDCDLECGDDAIVLKSSYTLNRLDYCENVKVERCRIKSRCNAFKLGTESNGGFKNVSFSDSEIYETRLAGIAIESVDGGKTDGVCVKNIKMRNVGTPIFVHLGNRLRGPKGTSVGEIKNIVIESVDARGPYEPFEIIANNYTNYLLKNDIHDPKVVEAACAEKQTDGWQVTSNVCGLKGHPLRDITLKDIYFELEGGVEEYSLSVPETADEYPEAYAYGRVLPAKGAYFRHIDGLNIENFTVKTYRPDKRETFVFDDVTALKVGE